MIVRVRVGIGGLRCVPMSVFVSVRGGGVLHRLTLLSALVVLIMPISVSLLASVLVVVGVFLIVLRMLVLVFVRVAEGATPCATAPCNAVKHAAGHGYVRPLRRSLASGSCNGRQVVERSSVRLAAATML
jgi:hypothetical protein